ncbi:MULTISPECIES: cache domain-containing protein [unclassified Pseudomonas]|uniref:PDC sensor domain-containing protein n=1 Tax=unclassified Pseudomonas TaxID=196821 RepID=UPI000BA32FCB|nr:MULTISPECIES: cache domain-containing protein [unclassified Pseudomonas]MCU1722715.1 cache domain-containing protein [Pseudomonas sp. 5P_5.1_Bac1]MCU1733073.1 cache domain-containing protein [Pseudomonas sp. 20P_3.2_Bac4]MCU1744174.1 cache domain-containing protein [Pseudomonas sp. 20P_3.2_Bac5]
MFALSDNASFSACAQQLDSTLGTIFNQVRELVEDTRSLWERVLAEGRQPAAKDLASLRPAIDRQLLATGAFGCGGGVIVEPNCLADREMHLEWWYLADGGKTLPLRPNFDRRRENYYDYTEMPWYRRPRDTGKSVVEGPYVDLYGTNLYVLTFTMPIMVQGRFIGVAGLDLSLHNVERLLVRSLMRLDHEAVLLSADGRVIASNTANWMVGDLVSTLLSNMQLDEIRLTLSESETGWSLVRLPGLRKAL